jgi:hypothetical protein
MFFSRRNPHDFMPLCSVAGGELLPANRCRRYKLPGLSVFGGNRGGFRQSARLSYEDM